MRDDAISQAEIDALVRGLAGADEGKQAPAAGAPDETALLRPVLESALKEAGGALADLAGVPCQATVAALEKVTAAEAAGRVSGAAMTGRSDLTGGLSGPLCFVVPQETGLAIITQIYGGVAPSKIDEAALGALADGLSQMLQGGMGAISSALGAEVTAGPVTVQHGGLPAEALGVEEGAAVYVAAVDLTLGESGGQLLQVFPAEAAAPLVEALQQQSAPAMQGGEQPQGSGSVVKAPAAQAAQQTAAAVAPAAGAGTQAPPFPDLTPKPQREEPRNIELLLDVTLQVTVELGRTRRQIREVLSLGPGSVVELDRLAGEPVDVLINGKLIAKGEVVVIDENYGVRITDIISPAERVQSLR